MSESVVCEWDVECGVGYGVRVRVWSVSESVERE